MIFQDGLLVLDNVIERLLVLQNQILVLFDGALVLQNDLLIVQNMCLICDNVLFSHNFSLGYYRRSGRLFSLPVSEIHIMAGH